MTPEAAAMVAQLREEVVRLEALRPTAPAIYHKAIGLGLKFAHYMIEAVEEDDPEGLRLAQEVREGAPYMDLMAASALSAQPNAAPAGDYLDAGGVHTYYEVAGQGEPLLLLHGGSSTIESWGAQVPAFAERYRVYLPERRGHGRTPDVEGPTGFDIMARDTIAFMEALEISSAHLVGWSDGGNVGLEIALVRPDLVRKLVIIGAGDDFDVMQPEGPKYTAELRAQAQHLTPDAVPPMLREAYDQLSPDGADHFPVVFDKLMAAWRSGPRHALGDLARLSAPTLVMVGDDDVLTADHAAAIQRTIPDAQLAVVPGTDHLLQFEKPDLVNRIILDFLADKQAPKLLSER